MTSSQLAKMSLSSAPEKDLARHLRDLSLNKLGIDGRPVQKFSDVVPISIGFDVIRINDVDQRGNTTLQGLLKMKWKDAFLTWNPQDFGGVDWIALQPNDIWRPDVAVWNDQLQGAAALSKDMHDAAVLIMADGTCIWIPRVNLKVGSKDNGDGTATVYLVTGSWVYDTTKVDVQFYDGKADVEKTLYDPNDGIQIAGHSATREDIEYAAAPGLKYTTITFNIVVKK